jgi:predicted aspartyl protease
MANDEETGWAKIRITQKADDLIQHGPTIPVVVVRLPVDPTRMQCVYAQIDTGAAGSIISDSLANRLGLERIDFGEVRQAGRVVITAPYFHVRFILGRGIEIDLDVAALSTFDPPHDVLLGRDILASCRLDVDFLSGETRLHIKASS